MLHYRVLEGEKPLIILHGLYGSGDNWFAMAKQFAPEYKVYLPDLRNHGNSFHNAVHNYEVMAKDVYQIIEKEKLSDIVLLGHSMGGKAAMQLSLMYPDLFEKLIVVDISPFSYVKASSEMKQQAIFHNTIIDTFLNVDVSGNKGRIEIEDAMAEKIPSANVRMFLLKNLKRAKDKSFYWQHNTQALKDNIDDILYASIKALKEFDKPVLFIKGENSPYIKDAEEPELKKLFKKATLTTIFDAGHWVHAEQPEMFLKVVKDYLLE